jgi:hypothetical protein
MMTALAVRTGLPGTLRPNGYDLPDDLSYDEWKGVVALAEHIEAASSWWLGDAIVYGERRFPERHAQAFPTAEEDPSGARQARMKSAAWVSAKFPPVTRVTGASWTHHRVVAGLERDDAVDLLQRAARADPPWSSRELARRADQITQAIAGTAVTSEGEPIDAPAPLSQDDLTDEYRTALEARMAGVGKRHAVGYARGWVDCLVWLHQQDAFTREIEL